MAGAAERDEGQRRGEVPLAVAQQEVVAVPRPPDGRAVVGSRVGPGLPVRRGASVGMVVAAVVTTPRVGAPVSVATRRVRRGRAAHVPVLIDLRLTMPAVPDRRVPPRVQRVPPPVWLGTPVLLPEPAVLPETAVLPDGALVPERRVASAIANARRSGRSGGIGTSRRGHPRPAEGSVPRRCSVARRRAPRVRRRRSAAAVRRGWAATRSRVVRRCANC